MKTYKMLSTRTGSCDGLKVETFTKGETYPLNPELAEQFYHLGAVEEVTADEPQTARNRSTKVTGPAETKVVTPDETKEGEVGVALDTQNVEELVALARDTYGLEVDSTMGESELRALIEQAEGEESEDDDAKDTKKAKKKGKK